MTFPLGVLTPGTGVLTGATTATFGVTFPLGVLAGAATVYVFVDQNATTPPYDFRRNPTTDRAYMLARFRTATPRGLNVFILTDDTVTTRQPHRQSEISRTLYGGHDVPTDLTDDEITLLLASGLIAAE